MMTDAECARACLGSYSGLYPFDHIIYSASLGNVWVGVRQLQDVTLVAFRGSSCPLDWLRDFRAVMTRDPELGDIEEGFGEGLDSVYKAIDPATTAKPVLVTGHSLGAGRGLLFAGRMVAAGIAPAAVVVFGSPRPGAEKLRYILSGTQVRSYHNFGDPVGDVPFPLPELPYVHASDRIEICVRPPGGYGNPLAPHAMTLYAQAQELSSGITC